MKQQRAKVIEELVTTETDYHSQMQVCCDKLIPAIQQVRPEHKHTCTATVPLSDGIADCRG